MVTASPSGNDYLDVFKAHIQRRTQVILTDIQQARTILLDKILRKALRLLDHSLKLSEVWPDTRVLLLTIAPKMEQAGYRDEWMPYLVQGIRQSQQLGDDEAKAELHLYLGMLYQLRGRYQTARLQLETSVSIFEGLNRPRDQARALNRLAYVARFQRDFEAASRLAEQASRLLDPEDPEQAFSHFVVGLVALDERDWPKAVHFSKQAFNLWAQENNQRMMGRSLMCRGVALEKMKAYPEAMAVCEQAVNLFEAIQDPVYLAAAQMNLGNVYHALERFNEALECYLPAERVFRQTQDQSHLAMVANNIGFTYRCLQQWDKARAAYLLSIEHRKKVGDVALLVNTIDGLGVVYMAEGNYAEAKATFEAALNQLAQIEGQPSYDHLFEMITTHLQEVSGKTDSL